MTKKQMNLTEVLFPAITTYPTETKSLSDGMGSTWARAEGDSPRHYNHSGTQADKGPTMCLSHGSRCSTEELEAFPVSTHSGTNHFSHLTSQD